MLGCNFSELDSLLSSIRYYTDYIYSKVSCPTSFLAELVCLYRWILCWSVLDAYVVPESFLTSTLLRNDTELCVVFVFYDVVV